MKLMPNQSPNLTPDDAPAPASEGVRCPTCSCGNCPVLYTRRRGNVTVRCRQCPRCRRRFSTTERVNGGAQ